MFVTLCIFTLIALILAREADDQRNYWITIGVVAMLASLVLYWRTPGPLQLPVYFGFLAGAVAGQSSRRSLSIPVSIVVMIIGACIGVFIGAAFLMGVFFR
jgi:hypothetical protein